MVADVVTSLKTRSPTGVCGQYSSYGPVTPVGGGGGGPCPAVAITGEMGRPGGIACAGPDGMTSFGYGEQLKGGNGVGNAASLKCNVKSDVNARAMSPLVAVNGPMVAGDDGTASVIPEGGTGFGTGSS